MPFWKKSPAAAKDPQSPPPLRTKPSRLLAKLKRGNKTVEDLTSAPEPVYHGRPTWADVSVEAKAAEATTALYLSQREEFAAQRRRELEAEEKEKRRRGMVFWPEEEEEGEEEGGEQGGAGNGNGQNDEPALPLAPAAHEAAYLRGENARLAARLARRDAQIARLNDRIAALERRLAAPAPTTVPAGAALRRVPSGWDEEEEEEEEEEEGERPLTPLLPPMPPRPLFF